MKHSSKGNFTVYEESDICSLDEYSETLGEELEDKLEEVEQEIEESAYDDTEIKADIVSLQEENETLQTENTRLKATLPTTTGSGENITLSNTAELEFIQPPLPRGNSEQDGEPSPTNEVPITNVTGDVEVLVQNKNLALNDDPENPDANYVSSGGGTQPVQYSSTEGGYYTTNHRRRTWGILKAGKYTISCKAKARSAGESAYCILINKPSGLINAFPLKSSLTNTYQIFSVTFTLTEDTEVYCTFYNTLYWKDIQLEQGTTATTYTPHKEQTLPLTLGNIELCKIGDYQDYFYKENSKWYLYKAIGKLILNGSEEWNVWNLSSETNQRFYLNLDVSKASLTNNVATMLCNRFQIDRSTSNDVEHYTFSATSGHYSQPLIIINRSRLSTVDVAGFKTWLSSNNVVVYYQLETPTSTEITDTTLINQLEEISQAISYEEQTNISGSSDESNPLFSVEAYQSTKLILQEISNAVVALGGV